MDPSSERGDNDRRKRQRTSIQLDQSNDDCESCEKDLDFYFPDGTVCLRAIDTLFKVYQGYLAKHSQVFSSLFTLPPPESPDQPPQEMFDGVPVVRLLDEPNDIQAVLNLMYNAPPECLSFTTLASIIRIAHKYQMDQYLTWAVKQLKCSYPTRNLPMEDVYDHPNWKLYTKPEFLFEMIALTTLLNEPDLEPTAELAYYALAIHSWTVQEMGAKSFGNLSGGLLATVIAIQQQGRKQHSDITNVLSNQSCQPNTCRWKSEAVGALGRGLTGDFLFSMLEVSKNLQTLQICRMCQQRSCILGEVARTKFKGMHRLFPT